MTDVFLDESVLKIEAEEEHPLGAYVLMEQWTFMIRAIIISSLGAHFSMAAKLRFPCTNNMAKYEVCIVVLKATLDINVKNLEACEDSILIISQSMGDWEVSTPILIKHKGYLTKLCKGFRSISFDYLPSLKKSACWRLSNFILHYQNTWKTRFSSYHSWDPWSAYLLPYWSRARWQSFLPWYQNVSKGRQLSRITQSGKQKD